MYFSGTRDTANSRLRFAAYGLAIALLAACSRGEPTPKGNEDAPIGPYLVGIYGPTATPKGTWTDGADDARMERSVCAFGPMAGDTLGRRLLAVCATPLDAGHATPGLIDFHELKPAPDGWHPVEIARDQEFGNDGNPGTVSLVRLGRNRGGFVVEETWIGQGFVLGSRSLLEFRGGTLATLATLRTDLDNQGTLDCDDAGACNGDLVSLQFDQHLDASEIDADAYPLRVHEHGTECGQAVDRQHRFAFEAGTGRYSIPPALMREDCLRNVNPGSGVARP
ncbi:MAG: hypothetical protein ACREO3_03570 [Arenimonas sp.]